MLPSRVEPHERTCVAVIRVRFTLPLETLRPTTSAKPSALAAEILGVRWVVPLHVRGWAHFSEGPADVLAAFEHAGLTDRLRGTDLGHWVDLPV